jgi:hypothetical protein
MHAFLFSLIRAICPAHIILLDLIILIILVHWWNIKIIQRTGDMEETEWKQGSGPIQIHRKLHTDKWKTLEVKVKGKDIPVTGCGGP